MSETKQRKVWIDVLKGIAILLVLIAHNPSVHQENFYFTFFDIPLFFLISGYLFNPDILFNPLVRKKYNINLLILR